MEKVDMPLKAELKVAPCSFTPVRRKESTLNHGRLDRDVEKEWTAARCNRLLRPLTSRVSILQRIKQSALDRMKSQSKKGKSASEININAAGCETNNNNANWIGRKKVKRTYSGKAGNKGSGQYVTNPYSSSRLSSNGGSSSVPGEIVVPTPLLNRAWRNTSSPYRAIPYKGNALGGCQHRSADSVFAVPTKARLPGTSKTQPLGSQALSKIRDTTSSTRFNIYEGIYNGLDALLRATHPISNSLKKGPKSLFSMCLTTVPKYITMEEKLLSSEIERVGNHSAIEQRDISTEIYDDLELFGSSGRGWTHLQSVVRAHGVQIICDAILEGLLDCEFCEMLVDLCIHCGHYDEAELVLSSLLSRCKFPNPTLSESLFEEDDFHQPLLKIQKFVEVTGRRGYGYRQFSILIQSGILSFQWVVTPAFTPIWTGLMQDLSLDSAKVDAMKLMNTILPRLVEYVSLSDSWLDTDLYKVCRTTLLSVLTTISSIILLSREVIGNSFKQESKNTTTISGTHSMILKNCLEIIKGHAKESYLQCTILLLACLVTEPHADNISDFIIDPLYRMYAEENGETNAEMPSNIFEKPLSAYNEAVRFISSVARCCGKGASTSGFEYLQHIHQRLKRVNTGRGLKARTIWYGIIVDSAFAFAQEAPGQKYLDYADSLDGELHADSSRRPESARKETRYPSMAFRWEEGISSWVTATPATDISKNKTKSRAPNVESDEDEFGSPSVSRVQRPIPLGGGSKRKLDSDEYAVPDTQLPPKSKNDTRRGKGSLFDIWHCDTSDDELNSGYESSQKTRVLNEVRNAASRRRSKLFGTKQGKESRANHHKQPSFSDDELGI
ncbi:hypothetical protein DSL72_007853 [Monilinia vaccinii-corymbosi]|uniref:Uncharacterized protein n=1 Tax=Monilinia vaccinii-corymbosi TaxID=61207 RepID=A0A8A3PJ30_9HELO|nr:hypothetical protein DSL72_007853 [Monilinia vaccinii-corymbosi]